jgi:hypothetical protein
MLTNQIAVFLATVYLYANTKAGFDRAAADAQKLWDEVARRMANG